MFLLRHSTQYARHIRSHVHYNSHQSEMNAILKCQYCTVFCILVLWVPMPDREGKRARARRTLLSLSPYSRCKMSVWLQQNIRMKCWDRKRCVENHSLPNQITCWLLAAAGRFSFWNSRFLLSYKIAIKMWIKSVDRKFVTMCHFRCQTNGMVITFGVDAFFLLFCSGIEWHRKVLASQRGHANWPKKHESTMKFSWFTEVPSWTKINS